MNLCLLGRLFVCVFSTVSTDTALFYYYFIYGLHASEWVPPTATSGEIRIQLWGPQQAQYMGATLSSGRDEFIPNSSPHRLIWQTLGDRRRVIGSICLCIWDWCGYVAVCVSRSYCTEGVGDTPQRDVILLLFTVISQVQGSEIMEGWCVTGQHRPARPDPVTIVLMSLYVNLNLCWF